MGLLKKVARSITRPVAQVVHHVTHPAKTIKAVTKPVLKLVDHVVPGGKYLTGSRQARQKRLYNIALNEHNSYAETAQNNINNFSNQLKEELSKLSGLDEQRKQHTAQIPQLQAQAEQHQRGMQNLEQHRMNLGSEANALFELFENFKSKAPSKVLY